MLDLRNDNSQGEGKTQTYGNINVPVTAQPGTLALSPYLNFDPTYFSSKDPEFIIPQGEARVRGRFEMAFTEIGAFCMTGALVGGVLGLYRGIKATSLAGETGKLRKTQLINHVSKGGSSLANTFGVISVMYSGFGVFLAKVRDTEDSWNTLGAATATGFLYKSAGGLRKSIVAGGIGFGIASLYCLWNVRHKFSNINTTSSYNPASK